MTEQVTTEDLSPGDVVRLFASHDFKTVASVMPSGSRGAIVAFTDGTRSTIGRGAEWTRQGRLQGTGPGEAR